MKREEEATLFIGIGRTGCRTLGFLADRLAETVEAGGEASGNPAFLFVKTEKEDEGNAWFPSVTVHLGRESVAGCHLFPACADGRPDVPEDADCWWCDPDGKPYQVPLESSLSARPGADALNGAHLAWSSMRAVETAVEELADGTDLLDGWLPDGIRHVDVVSVFSSAHGVARGAWAFVVSAAKTALARKGIGSIRSRAIVFDASCFPKIEEAGPDLADRMRANSLSFLSELPLWLELAQPGCNLPSLERPDWGGGRFDRIVLADARSLFSPNRVPVDGWNLFFGIRKALFPDEFVVARLLQQELSKEHDDWTAREINNWHPVQTKVDVSLFVDDSIVRNRFALRLLQGWISDRKDGIPSAVEAVRVRLFGRDRSTSEPFRVPELFSYGDIVVAADLGQDEFEAFFVRRCDEEKKRLERIKREFVQRVAGGDPGVVAAWLRTAIPVRPGDFPLAEILERNRARWLSDWERGLPKQEEDSWGRLLECAGRKVARASVREILSDSGETRRFFVSALLGTGRRQLDARNRFANAKTDAMAWLPTGFGDSPDRAVPPNVREGVEFRTSGCPDRVDAIFAAFPEAGRDKFVQSFKEIPALRDRKVLELLEKAEDPETGGCFVRDGEEWFSALAPVSFPFPEFVRNPAFARHRWRPWKKESPKKTLGSTSEAETERRTNGGVKSTETDIFISYSRRDLAAVKPIKAELEAAGLSCWMDLQGIESGSEEFTDKIAAAIEGSVATLFFLSDGSQESRWSLNELRVARDEGKHVVLVRFNDDRMKTKFKLEFGGSDIIDWRISEQKEKLLRNLLEWTGKSQSSCPSAQVSRQGASSSPADAVVKPL